MRTDKINYTCDDCHESAVFRSDEKARKSGWALARDNVTCWCPSCAPAHRLGGANGKRITRRHKLPNSFEQLQFNI